jgi:hypothetical protein
MSNKKIIGLLKVLYSVLLFCYTIYGYGKNLSEVFCSERRPGVPLSPLSGWGNVSCFSVYNATYGLPIFQVQDSSVCYAETCSELQEDVMPEFFENVYKTNLYESYSYKMNSSGFEAQFFKNERFTVLSCDGFGSKSTDVGSMTGASFNMDDFTWTQVNKVVTNDSQQHYYANCVETVYLQDCTFSTRSQLNFLIFSVSVVALFFVLLVLSFFSIHFRFWSCYLLSPLLGDNMFVLMKFCNPLDGKYSVKKKGSIYYTVEECEPQIFDSFGGGDMFVKKSMYSFKITGNRLTIFESKGFLSVVFDGVLDKTKMDQVMQIMIAISISSENWPINSECDHFIGMEAFIEYLLNDKLNLKRLVLDKDSTILNLRFETFLMDYRGLDCNTIKVLITHNKLFFGYFNLPCMLRSMERRFNWCSRPASSSNSQWKRYTNDVSKFLTSSGHKQPFFQFKNKNVSYTPSLLQAINVVANDSYKELEFSDIAIPVNDNIAPKKSKLESEVDIAFEEVFGKYTRLPDNDVFSERDLEVINQCKSLDEMRTCMQNTDAVLELKKERSEILEQSRQIQDKDREIKSAYKGFTGNSAKTAQKMIKKWGSVDNLDYKSALLKEESETLKAKDLSNKLKERKMDSFQNRILTDEYVFIKDEGNRRSLKQKFLRKFQEENCADKIDKKSLSECSMYASLLKRNKNINKSSIPRKCYNLEKNKECIIELKNRYSSLYIGEEEKLRSIIYASNPKKNKKPIFERQTEGDEGSATEESKAIVDFHWKNMLSVKSCVYKARYNKEEGRPVIDPKSKFSRQCNKVFKSLASSCLISKQLEHGAERLDVNLHECKKLLKREKASDHLESLKRSINDFTRKESIDYAAKKREENIERIKEKMKLRGSIK